MLILKWDKSKVNRPRADQADMYQSWKIDYSSLSDLKSKEIPSSIVKQQLGTNWAHLVLPP